MQIFAAEKELEDKILSTRTLSYHTALEVDGKTQEDMSRILAALKSDAHTSLATRVSERIKAILASVGWNKNDDVFDRNQMWLARATPIGTPINKEHNAKEIIGHIDSVSAIDFDGNLIPFNSDIAQVPNLYHLVTSGVLYTEYFHEAKDKEAAYKLVEEIMNGEWYVSMETLFDDFDYAVIKPDGARAVIGRKEETAFLTKVLRCYGGEGIHEGYRVGRLLKEMTFSGKGVVKKPANAASVFLLSKDSSYAEWENFEILENFGVRTPDELPQHEKSVGDTQNHTVSNTGDIEMSEELKALQAENATLKAEKTAKAEVEATHKQEVTALQAKITEATAAKDKLVADHAAALAEKDNIVASKDAELATLAAAKAVADKQVADLNAEIEKTKAAQAKATRVSQLEKVGFDAAKAVELADKFVALSDEQFAEFLTVSEWGFKGKKDDKKEDKDKKEKAKAKSVADILNDVEDDTDEDPSFTSGSELDEADADKILALGKALGAAMASNNKKKFANSNEE